MVQDKKNIIRLLVNNETFISALWHNDPAYERWLQANPVFLRFANGLKRALQNHLASEQANFIAMLSVESQMERTLDNNIGLHEYLDENYEKIKKAANHWNLYYQNPLSQGSANDKFEQPVSSVRQNSANIGFVSVKHRADANSNDLLTLAKKLDAKNQEVEKINIEIKEALRDFKAKEQNAQEGHFGDALKAIGKFLEKTTAPQHLTKDKGLYKPDLNRSYEALVSATKSLTNDNRYLDEDKKTIDPIQYLSDLDHKLEIVIRKMDTYNRNRAGKITEFLHDNTQFFKRIGLSPLFTDRMALVKFNKEALQTLQPNQTKLRGTNFYAVFINNNAKNNNPGEEAENQKIEKSASAVDFKAYVESRDTLIKLKTKRESLVRDQEGLQKRMETAAQQKDQPQPAPKMQQHADAVAIMQPISLSQ